MIKTIYLIHESHTDIGYTNGQGRILRWHAAFIRQAIELAEDDPAFRWTCETFIQVEQFWAAADQGWRNRFLDQVRAGRIGLTANWAHFNELPDEAVLHAFAKRARSFADEHNLPLNTAVMADINGCPLAYARALAANGISLILTHVHPHHGCVPLRARMQPFRWDLGDGNTILVYHQDHYHTANELGLFPGAEINYLNFREPVRAFDEDTLNRRLPVYVREIEKSGWPYDFLVLTGSGMITDNGAPSASVTARIERWNANPPLCVNIQMITAGDLARIFSERAIQVPTFCGDWPDWWADGSAGDPEGTILYRQAQRERRWLSAATEAFPEVKISLDALDTCLGFYAEHTFGHSASITVPWNPLAQQLHVRKAGYAAEAADIAECLGEQAGEAFGYGPLAYGRPPRFKIVNPFRQDLVQPVEMEFDGCDVHFHQLGGPIEVIDVQDDSLIPHQTMPSLRGLKVVCQIEVPQQSTRQLLIRPAQIELAQPLTIPGRCGHRDLASDPCNVIDATVKNDHATLEWDASGRVIAWKDAKTGRNLLTQPDAFAFQMNRSATAKDGASQYARRGAMARNRQASDAQQLTAKATGFRRISTGPLFDVIATDYEAPGFELLRAEWTIYRNLPRVDVEVICHKLGTWDPENVYCSLPFTAGDGSQFWIDRGWAMRPWVDQLPGTLTDFYGAQDGVGWCTDNFGVVVVPVDSHLIHCGDLAYRTRRLMGDPELPSVPGQVYAWLMTNYWETNFSAEIGGFYSFRFRVGWGKDLADPARALQWARTAGVGLKAVHQKK